MLRDISWDIGCWLAPYLGKIAMAVVASLLFIYGNDIHGVVKKGVSGYPFAVRLSVFVPLCAFGYGLLTVWLAVLLRRLLYSVDRAWLFPLIVAMFLVIGLAATARKQM